MPGTFPPSQSISILTVLPVVVLCLLSIGWIVWTVRRRDPSGKIAIWLLLLGSVWLLPFLFTEASQREKSIISTGILLVSSMAGGGLFLSFARLEWKHQRSVAKTVVLGLPAVLLWFLLLESSTRNTGHLEAGWRSRCRNNLKEIGLALHNWHDEHGRFPDADLSQPEHPPLSWRIALLPYLDRAPLLGQYDRTAAWDAEINLPIAQTDVPPLLCPANSNAQDDQGRYFTAYALITGPETTFPEGRGLTLKDVTDGTSQTLLVAEACGLNIVWTQPKDIDVNQHPIGVNLPGDSPTHSPAVLSSYHRGGAHAAFADGSVRYLSADIDPQVLRALTTPSGGERLEDAGLP